MIWSSIFAPPPEGRHGNAGVGIIEGPGRHQLNLSARKLFAVTEGVRMQFQADFFNAFNQTNLNDPGVAFGTRGGTPSIARAIAAM